MAAVERGLRLVAGPARRSSTRVTLVDDVVEGSAPSASDQALAGEVLVLVDALTCVELTADAAVLAQHARAAALRLHALLRDADGLTSPTGRADDAAIPSPSVSWGRWTFPTAGKVVAPGLTVDIDGCCAHLEGRVVQLSARQTRLLGAVAAQPGRVVPYGALGLVGWRDAETDRRGALHLQFSALRSVLGLHGGSCRLRAVARIGYRLEAPPPSDG